jgi:hypothetical protein
MNAHPILEAALAYANSGQRVMFVALDKNPFTAHGVYDATTDATVTKKSFAKYRSRIAGVAIAVPNSYRVVDVDPRHDGHKTVATWPALPETVTAETGSGGRHHLFSFPPGEYRFKIGQGIELLGPCRYFIVAPSLHETGGVYRWLSPPQTPIARAPNWLVQLALLPKVIPIVRPTRPLTGDVVERARRYLAKMDPSISGAGGHDAAFMAASTLVRGFALDEGTALTLLATEFNPRCQPPWSEKELRHKISQALTRGRMQVGALLERRCG